MASVFEPPKIASAGGVSAIQAPQQPGYQSPYGFRNANQVMRGQGNARSPFLAPNQQDGATPFQPPQQPGQGQPPPGINNTPDPYQGGGKKGYDPYAMTGYEQDVLAGEYLDLDNNQYLGDYVQAIQDEALQDLSAASSQLQSPFAAAGGTMGMSGASAAAQAQMAQDWNRSLQATVSGVYQGVYETERMLQTEVAGIVSGRRSSAYQSDQALAAAKAQAEATKYSARLAYELGQDQLAVDLWYKGEQLYQDSIALAAALSGDYTQITSDLLARYGITTTQGEQGDPWAAGLEGALWGGTYGQGLSDMYGWGDGS